MGGLLVRADADETIGTGHAMRCLALVQAWRDAGRGAASLASCRLPERLRRRYEREGARFIDLGPGVGAFSRLVRDSDAAWVVLDGYRFRSDHQRAVADSRKKLLIVDDGGIAGEYLADVVVDPNPFADESSYVRKLPTTQLLLGPRYALLRRELRGVGSPTAFGKDARRILVTFGGADVAGLSLLALEALGSMDVALTLAVGPANPHRDEIERAAAALANVDVAFDPPDMRPLMDGAALALTAAGGTCLELAHHGIPQIVVVVADNQQKVAQALEERGVAVSLGVAADLTAAVLRERVRSVLSNPSTRRSMGAAGVNLVDGQGATRVVAEMRLDTSDGTATK